MFSALKRWRDEGYINIYGTDVVRAWTQRLLPAEDGLSRILDIGCGDGRDLLAMGEGISGKADLYGIECTENLASQACRHGVRTFALDLETSSLPFRDNFFDLVVANQVLEHLKNWIWVFQEQIRVTKV